jgi:hypothetical protein
MAKTKMNISDWTQIISTAFAAASAAMSCLSIWFVRRQIHSADRATEASVFIKVNEEWKSIYPVYRQVLVREIDWEHFRSYTDRDAYMNSPVWQQIRPVFAFYEFLGSCVVSGLLKPDLVFRLVNVNAHLWEKYAPLIEEMRQMKPQPYPDLYLHWQRLSEMRKSHVFR